MDVITIPPSVYTPMLAQNTNEHINDSPPALLQVKGFVYNRRVNLNPESFLIRNRNNIIIEPNTWRFILFPMSVVTNVPAICIGVCNVRTLYCHGLSQPVIAFHTNDNYIKIPLYNNSKKSVNLNPFELTIRCTIIIRRNPYTSSMKYPMI